MPPAVRQALIAAVVGAAAGVALTAGGHRGVDAILAIPLFAPDHALLGHRALVVAGAAAWVVFSLYWTFAARRTAATVRAETNASRRVHVILTNLALALEIAPVHGLGRFAPVSVPLMLAGLFIEAVGLLVAIWARNHLGANWSGEITIKQQHELVRSGPYRRVRHPIYTGILLMYAGLAIVTGERLAVLGFVIALLAYARKIRLEERNLAEAFGASYAQYRRESWALVPGVY